MQQGAFMQRQAWCMAQACPSRHMHAWHASVSHAQACVQAWGEGMQPCSHCCPASTGSNMLWCPREASTCKLLHVTISTSLPVAGSRLDVAHVHGRARMQLTVLASSHLLHHAPWPQRCCKGLGLHRLLHLARLHAGREHAHAPCCARGPMQAQRQAPGLLVRSRSLHTHHPACRKVSTWRVVFQLARLADDLSSTLRHNMYY